MSMNQLVNEDTLNAANDLLFCFVLTVQQTLLDPPNAEPPTEENAV